MITVNLNDTKLAENLKALQELKASGMFTDEQLQILYDKQIEKDLMAEDTEKPITVVTVKFNNKTNKTYYYKYIGDEPVSIGDILTVETPYQETAEVKVRLK